MTSARPKRPEGGHPTGLLSAHLFASSSFPSFRYIPFQRLPPAIPAIDDIGSLWDTCVHGAFQFIRQTDRHQAIARDGATSTRRVGQVSLQPVSVAISQTRSKAAGP